MATGVIHPRLTAVVKLFHYYGNWAEEWLARELATDAEGAGERCPCEENPLQEAEEGEKVDHGHNCDSKQKCRAYNDYRAENDPNQGCHHGNMIAQNRCFVKGGSTKFRSN